MEYQVLCLQGDQVQGPASITCEVVPTSNEVIPVPPPTRTAPLPIPVTNMRSVVWTVEVRLVPGGGGGRGWTFRLVWRRMV